VSCVVTAIDFSASSVAAAKLAAQLAGEFSAQLTLAHIVEPLAVPAQWQSLAEESGEVRVGRAHAELNGWLSRSAGPLNART